MNRYPVFLTMTIVLLMSFNNFGQEPHPGFFMPDYLQSEHIIERYAGIGIGVLSMREIADYDLYHVLYYNPAGPNNDDVKWHETKYRHGQYALLTVDGFASVITPFAKIWGRMVHLEIGAEALAQYFVVPSAHYNTISSEEHYDISFNNHPTYLNANIHSSLWLNEMVAIGASYRHDLYFMHTNDDRVFQKSFLVHSHGFSPKISFWYALKRVMPNSRWHIRSSLAPYNIWMNADSDFRSLSAALVFLKGNRNNGFFSLFVQYHDIKVFPAPGDINPGYRFDYDRQWVVGIQFGKAAL
ncbi:MAG: hypothetical protein RQ866_03635 [Bacteroidales bacterium]|nr:hypothetical protein [Bacteroidales bacterium]